MVGTDAATIVEPQHVVLITIPIVILIVQGFAHLLALEVDAPQEVFGCLVPVSPELKSRKLAHMEAYLEAFIYITLIVPGRPARCVIVC